jgi:uncharacterized membrane protein
MFLLLAPVVWRRRRLRQAKILGALFAIVGIYIFLEMATGFSTDLFVAGLVNGYGPNVTPFQKAIPLLMMVITLLILPHGLVSLNLGRLRDLRRVKK